MSRQSYIFLWIGLLKRSETKIYFCLDFNNPKGGGKTISLSHTKALHFLLFFFSGIMCWNPAFDVTPNSLITGIITEKGVFKPEELAEKLKPNGAS